jgi:hypothetical protein
LIVMSLVLAAAMRDCQVDRSHELDSIKDIFPPRALLQRQISSNAPVPYLSDGF